MNVVQNSIESLNLTFNIFLRQGNEDDGVKGESGEAESVEVSIFVAQIENAEGADWVVSGIR